MLHLQSNTVSLKGPPDKDTANFAKVDSTRLHPETQLGSFYNWVESFITVKFVFIYIKTYQKFIYNTKRK